MTDIVKTLPGKTAFRIGLYIWTDWGKLEMPNDYIFELKKRYHQILI